MTRIKEQPTGEQIARFRNYISTHPWQTAKTMPQIPHSYTLRRMSQNTPEFEWCVWFIHKFGYDQYFGRKAFRYFDCDGHQYWTMDGGDVKKTALINRAVKG